MDRRNPAPIHGMKGAVLMSKLWQSCTIGQGNVGKRFRLLANRGPSRANTLHTLSGFPGLGM